VGIGTCGWSYTADGAIRRVSTGQIQLCRALDIADRTQARESGAYRGFRVEDVSCPGYGASQVTRLVVQNKVAMSVAEAATTIG
jgi:hypothetical protein